MNRWSQQDEDSYRLPEGMVRIAYDADTQQYTYLNKSDGSHWEGQEGAEYGQMRKVGAGRFQPTGTLHTPRPPFSSSWSASTTSTASLASPPPTHFSEILENIEQERDISNESMKTIPASNGRRSWLEALWLRNLKSRFVSRSKVKKREKGLLEGIREQDIEKSRDLI